jgi:hypothetical protein
VPRTVEPFAKFAADSENWCFGPVFEMRLLYRDYDIEAAWRAAWSDQALRGPYKDWALTEKAPPRQRRGASLGALSFGIEETGVRAGVGTRADRAEPEPMFNRWLELWLPPRMAARIDPDWDARKDPGPENAVFWEALIALARRIKNRVPFRLAWLGNECSGPLSADVDHWLHVEHGTLIVDQSCQVNGADILDLGMASGRGG